MTQQPTVIFIVSSGRSGTTLLGNLLGQMDDSVHVGELHDLWDDVALGEKVCSCGQPYRECVFWGEVIRHIPEDFQPAVPHHYLDQRDKIRLQHIVASDMGLMPNPLVTTTDYQAAAQRLYTTIQTDSGACVIVDSSKLPRYLYLTEALPNIDVYPIHLVRDPRAVAYAQKNRTKNHFTSESLLRSTLRWVRQNAVVSWYWGRKNRRCLRLRYEDFAANPAPTLHAITAYAGIQDVEFKQSNEGWYFELQHVVSGNPIRVKTGWIPIKLEEEWRRHITRWDYAFVTLLTFPLLLLYGYRVFGAAHND